jgi:hypothetical protein
VELGVLCVSAVAVNIGYTQQALEWSMVQREFGTTKGHRRDAEDAEVAQRVEILKEAVGSFEGNDY